MTMILNASLIRIDTPGAANEAGKVVYTEGTPIDVRCCLDQPNFAQRQTAQTLDVVATAILYVLESAVAVSLTARKRVQVRSDSGDVQTYLIAKHALRIHNGQSHWELLLTSE